MFNASGEVPAENVARAASADMQALAEEDQEEIPTWGVAENVDHAVEVLYRGAKMNPLFAPHQLELERGIGVANVHATLALVGMLERIDSTLKELTAEVKKRAGG